VLAQGQEPIVLSRARDGMILGATPGFCRMTGYDREQLIGRTTADLDLWAEPAQRERMLERLAEAPAIADFDAELRTRTRDVLHCRISAQMIDREGEAQLFIVLRDVTELHRTERRLREAEQRYRTLVETLPAATYVDHLDGTPLYVSPQIADIYGCSADQWMSDTKFWLERVHPDDADRVDSWYERHRVSGEEVSYEYRLLLPSGEVRWVHDHVAPVLDADGVQVATQGVMVDITEHKHAAETVREQDQRLRELLEAMLRIGEQERQRIATELHDDTIQVMTAALLMLDRARRSEAQRSLEEACEMMREAIERTRRLTFQLRPPLLERDGLNAALRVLVDDAAEDTGWVTTLQIACRRYDFGIEDLVYRTIQELITNARKHARARRLDIEVVETAGELCATVRDDGVGFEPSQALDRSAMRHHLGLDSAIERVHLAGGTIELTASPGNGTSVRLAIPLPS
jgi:two-component system, NarL family, sensor histidine kinase UhpB